MSKNEDGEYELILGNPQLMGVFFIVIVLMGVFFAMGYLMGRSSTPAVTAEAAPRQKEAKPLVVDSPSPRSKDQDTPATEATPPQPVSTQPQTSAPAVDTPKAASAPKPVQATQSGGQPQPGTYLQLSATQKSEAELMVDVLRKKNFPALVTEIPEKPGTFRVLVGPIADGDVNKTKNDLQNASFPGKEALKRTY